MTAFVWITTGLVVLVCTGAAGWLLERRAETNRHCQQRNEYAAVWAAVRDGHVVAADGWEIYPLVQPDARIRYRRRGQKTWRAARLVPLLKVGVLEQTHVDQPRPKGI